MLTIAALWRGILLSTLATMLLLAAPGVNARLVPTGAQRSLLAKVAPSLADGNPVCGDEFVSYKIDFAPTANTEYGGLVKIGATDGYKIDFELLASQVDKVSLTKVIMKGGDFANIYIYGENGVTADTELITPLNLNNRNGMHYGISHVTFCYQLKLGIEVAATTTFTRTYSWEVSKAASPTSGSAKPGETTSYNWLISVPAPTHIDSNHGLGCTIVVTNPSNQPLPGFSANCGVGTGTGRRLLADGPTCTLDAIPAGGSSTCTTSVALPDSLSALGEGSSTPPGGTVSASVVPTSSLFVPASGSAAYAFTAPTTFVGDTATLADDGLAGFPKTLSVDDFKGANKDGVSYTIPATTTCPSTPSSYTSGSYTGTASNTVTLTDSAGNVDTATAEYTYTCTVWELAASIDATASFDRTWSWTVTKTSNVTNGQEGQASDKLYFGWTITATPSYTDSGTVACSVDVTNPSPFSVELTANGATCTDTTLVAGGQTSCDCSFDTEIIADGTVSVSVSVDWDTVPFKKAAVVKSASYSFGTTPASEANLDVTLTDDRAVPPLKKALTATAVTSGWTTSYGDSHLCNPSKSAYDATTLSYTETVTNTATVKNNNGDTLASATATTSVTCKVAELLLMKTLSNAISTAQTWTFMMAEGTFDANAVSSTSNTIASTNTEGFISSFSGANAALRADKKYTVCEQMQAGWNNEWKWKKDDSTMTPFFPANSDVRCVEVGAGTSFPLTAGSSHAIAVNNVPSGGIPLSPGYWSQWNKCTGGKQADTAFKNGGYASGFSLVEDLIASGAAGNSITWKVPIDTCIKAVNTLQGRLWTSGLNGKVLMSDPARKLARQVLAAQLNFAAGACTPPNVKAAIDEGVALLIKASFTGDSSGAYITKTVPTSKAMADANRLATLLDAYNNHNCNP